MFYFCRNSNAHKVYHQYENYLNSNETPYILRCEWEIKVFYIFAYCRSLASNVYVCILCASHFMFLYKSKVISEKFENNCHTKSNATYDVSQTMLTNLHVKQGQYWNFNFKLYRTNTK